MQISCGNPVQIPFFQVIKSSGSDWREKYFGSDLDDNFSNLHALQKLQKKEFVTRFAVNKIMHIRPHFTYARCRKSGLECCDDIFDQRF